MHVDPRTSARIVESFFSEALDISELAILYKVGLSDVVDCLEDFQRSAHQMSTSKRFRQKVVAFANHHMNISLPNVARAYFLKDERPIRNWIAEESAPKQDKQHNLLDKTDIWKERYMELYESCERFKHEAALSCHECKKRIHAALGEIKHNED